jgi:hypothetical protein
MVMNARLSGFIVSMALVAACSGDDPVDLGSGPVEQQRSGLAAFSGSWDGYAEGYAFVDGSDRLRLTLDANGNGTLEVGASAARVVPPATSGYDLFGSGLGYLNPGFGYSIEDASVESDRLKASVEPTSYFAAYCEQLTPVATSTAWSPTGFSCRPGRTLMTTEATATMEPTCSLADIVPDPSAPLGQSYGNVVAIDCGLVGCNGYCTCDAAGCRAMTREERNGRQVSATAGTVRLDGALEDSGQKFVGTLVLGEDGGDLTRIAVRMTRD